jgi:SAM-dependent methyltransferase
MNATSQANGPADAVACPTPRCGGRTRRLLPDQIHRNCPGLVFDLLHCATCGLAFVHPQPDDAALARLYENYPYHGLPVPSRVRRYSWRLRVARLVHWAAGRHRPPALARVLELLIGRSLSASVGVPAALSRDSPVAELGFGDGSWLLAMQKIGFSNLSGFDLESNASAKTALRSAGIRILGDPGSWPEQSFECVRLEHVLEHLPDPAKTLRQIFASLRPGGCLVLTVPSIHAWEPLDSLPGLPHLEYLQLPVHLYLHSTTSLEMFLADPGFETRYVGVLRPYRYLTLAALRPPKGEHGGPEPIGATSR